MTKVKGTKIDVELIFHSAPFRYNRNFIPNHYVPNETISILADTTKLVSIPVRTAGRRKIAWMTEATSKQVNRKTFSFIKSKTSMCTHISHFS